MPGLRWPAAEADRRRAAIIARGVPCRTSVEILGQLVAIVVEPLPGFPDLVQDVAECVAAITIRTNAPSFVRPRLFKRRVLIPTGLRGLPHLLVPARPGFRGGCLRQ